jgi:O-acetyl-ADP-ribose deacetylase (regulator of RNase III)
MIAPDDLATPGAPSIPDLLRGAAMVALGAVSRFLKENSTSLKEVRFVLYDPETFRAYEQALAPLTPRKG